MTVNTGADLPTSDDDSAYKLYVLAIKSAATRKKYTQNLIKFFDNGSIFPGVELEERCNLVVKQGKTDSEWLNRYFRDYCIESRDRLERKEVRPSTIWNTISAVKLFFAVNDFDVTKWKKYTRGIPFARKAVDDLLPSREQIVKMSQYPDRRIRPIVYCMASGGWRVGAWEYLRWGHVRPIYLNADGNGKEKLVAARVLIYAGEEEQYFCFITPEAYLSVKEWMDYRERSGEKITKDSWLMRDLWNQRLSMAKSNTVRKKGDNIAMVQNPKRLGQRGLVAQISQAWITQGIRGLLPPGKRRHEFAVAHVFRKYFKTVAEGAGMRSINIEMLMGHSIGVSNCYYRPTEDELLKDYLKAVPAMTFETPVISAKQLQELKETQARNADAIAAIVEEMHRQQAENAALNAEIARLKKAGASTSMLEELEKLELQLDEMRRMHLAATGGRKDSANIDG